METIKIGLLGLGTVGQGVINLFNSTAANIALKTGVELMITHACIRDPAVARECDLTAVTLTTNIEDIVSNPEIDVVIEVMGGIEPALTAISTALNNQKHVITANKALIAGYGARLLDLAIENDVDLRISATVAGGVPIIKVLAEGLAGDNINYIAGIVNGTANYVLTEMSEHELSFDEALELARTEGYAEQDSSYDVDGVDAAHKLAIMAAIAFGVPISLDDIHLESIADISAEDIDNAAELGFVIKQLALVETNDERDKLLLLVAPVLIPTHEYLAQVKGVMNAVFVESEALGDSVYYGAGAGSLPTASSILADLVDVLRGAPDLEFENRDTQEFDLADIADAEYSYYIRLVINDNPNNISQVASILARHDISIDQMKFKRTEEITDVSLVIVTNSCFEREVDAACEDLRNASIVEGDVLRIRIIDDLP